MGPGLHRTDTRIIEAPGWYQVITPSAPGSMLNEVVLSQVATEDADRVIAEAVRTYHSTGHPAKWCVGPWTRPVDFGERLARRGFSSWDVRGMSVATVGPFGAVRSIDAFEVDDAMLSEYIAAADRGWSVPRDQAEAQLVAHKAACSRRPRVAHFFGAKLDGRWIGTAGLLLRGGYAYLTAAQVDEAMRGRGVYRALIAVRMSFLRARGIPFAVTQAREATSAPMLEHLGFETHFRSRCYLLEPAR
jgi:GNAT superfamily N-acetyltransferase